MKNLVFAPLLAFAFFANVATAQTFKASLGDAIYEGKITDSFGADVGHEVTRVIACHNLTYSLSIMRETVVRTYGGAQVPVRTVILLRIDDFFVMSDKDGRPMLMRFTKMTGCGGEFQIQTSVPTK